MKVEYRFRRIKGGLPFIGVVELHLEELPHAQQHQIIEEYQGAGFTSQGYIESIPAQGYKDWKAGIKKGILYALSKITSPNYYQITIIAAQGLTTDTNPTILAYTASRAILDHLEHQELDEEKAALEEVVFGSWKNENSLEDFGA